MGYADAATTATDAGFQARVRGALYAQLARIGTGGATYPQQEAYFAALSRMLIDDPEKFVTAFSWVLTAYGGLTSAVTDAELDQALTALWPAVSGYLTAGP